MVVNVTLTSTEEISGATKTTEGFSSQVITSMVLPGPTMTVGSPNRSSIAVQASPSATTTAPPGAALFKSWALPSIQVSVKPTAASTVKLIATSSVNGE